MDSVTASTTPANTTKYRKKPIVVEARRLDMNDYDDACDVLRWCGGIACDIGECAAHIPTLEGETDASHGDWIIKGVKGEFYPCKPDIFGMTYELCD